MERERQNQASQRDGARGGPLPEHNLEVTRNQLQGIHNVADHVLNSIAPVEAEPYLQQSKQRGAQ